MFDIALFAIFNIEEDWRKKDDGFIPAHSIGMKSGLKKRNINFIRHRLATGAVGVRGNNFYDFRPMRTIFND